MIYIYINMYIYKYIFYIYIYTYIYISKIRYFLIINITKKFSIFEIIHLSLYIIFCQYIPFL